MTSFTRKEEATVIRVSLTLPSRRIRNTGLSCYDCHTVESQKSTARDVDG